MALDFGWTLVLNNRIDDQNLEPPGSRARGTRTLHRRRCVVMGGLLAGLLLAGAAQAEQAWVRGEIRLNVRTGPGTQYRIVGVAKTGDGVEILSRGDGWNQIRLPGEESETIEGWIPEGYLKPQPPPTVRLNEAENLVGRLESELSVLRSRTESLHNENEILTSRDGDQQNQIKQLTRENMELNAGARYPEWITGASIFAAGMILGAMLHRSQARRQPARIKL